MLTHVGDGRVSRRSGAPAPITTVQGWAQGSFVEAKAEVKAARSRQRRGKAEAEAEAESSRPRRGRLNSRQGRGEATPLKTLHPLDA